MACSITWTPRVSTRSLKSQRAADSRGLSSPIRREARAHRAITAERTAPCRSMQTSYRASRSSRRTRRMSRRVSAERRTCPLLGGHERGSRQRSGICGPRLLVLACAEQAAPLGLDSPAQIPLGCAARRAVIAGKAWRISPIAPSRTMSTRNCFSAGGNPLFSHKEAE